MSYNRPSPIPHRTAPRVLLGLILCAVASIDAKTAFAQMNQSFSSKYQQELIQRPGIGGGMNRYMYDRYFRDNVAVSPYTSGALLGGSESGTAYYSVVRGDVARRNAAMKSQAQYVQQRKAQGNIGYTANPGSGYLGAMPNTSGYYQQAPPPKTNGAYQNHWYGGWNR